MENGFNNVHKRISARCWMVHHRITQRYSSTTNRKIALYFFMQEPLCRFCSADRVHVSPGYASLSGN